MTQDREDQLAALSRKANLLRQRDLVMIQRAGMGHLGGDFSALDILVTLLLCRPARGPAASRCS